MSDKNLPSYVQQFTDTNIEVRVVFDLAGVLCSVNRSLIKALDRAEADMLGHYLWDFLDPASVSATLEMLNDLALGGSTNDFVNCCLTSRRRQVWFRWSCGPATPEGYFLASADVIPEPQKKPGSNGQACSNSAAHRSLQRCTC